MEAITVNGHSTEKDTRGVQNSEGVTNPNNPLEIAHQLHKARQGTESQSVTFDQKTTCENEVRWTDGVSFAPKGNVIEKYAGACNTDGVVWTQQTIGETPAMADMKTSKSAIIFFNSGKTLNMPDGTKIGFNVTGGSFTKGMYSPDGSSSYQPSTQQEMISYFQQFISNKFDLSLTEGGILKFNPRQNTILDQRQDGIRRLDITSP